MGRVKVQMGVGAQQTAPIIIIFNRFQMEQLKKTEKFKNFKLLATYLNDCWPSGDNFREFLIAGTAQIFPDVRIQRLFQKVRQFYREILRFTRFREAIIAKSNQKALKWGKNKLIVSVGKHYFCSQLFARKCLFFSQM